MSTQPSIKAVQVEHVTIESPKGFDTVRAALEATLPRVDEGITVLLQYGEANRALAEMKRASPLSIFGSRDHGAILLVAGLRRRAVQYDIGNPLTASRMTRHQLSAALYAPIRVLLREDARGVVAFEYDRPTSTFGQFGDAEVDAVARRLEAELQETLARVAGG